MQEKTFDKLSVNIDHVYWLIFPFFLFPPKKKGEEEKENELTKPVLNKLFCYPLGFHRHIVIFCLQTIINYIKKGEIVITWKCRHFGIHNNINDYSM